MSLSPSAAVYETPKEYADRRHDRYGFVLALVFIGLVLVVASTVFTPVSIGSGISSEISLVGP